MFYKKRFLKIEKVVLKAPALESLFLVNFVEIALRHGCSPVNLLHIFRTPFLKNTSGWLVLLLVIQKIIAKEFSKIHLFKPELCVAIARIHSHDIANLQFLSSMNCIALRNYCSASAVIVVLCFKNTLKYTPV